MDFEEEMSSTDDWSVKGPSAGPTAAPLYSFGGSERQMTFEEALEGERRVDGWVWGEGGVKIGLREEVKKRSAREAELVEFQEVGSDAADLELGHNAGKIRMVDLEEEAGGVVKDGWVVDEAWKEYEEAAEWVSNVPSAQLPTTLQAKGTEGEDSFVEKVVVVPPNRRTKVGRRRGRSEVAEDWEKGQLAVWEEIFGLR